MTAPSSYASGWGRRERSYSLSYTSGRAILKREFAGKSDSVRMRLFDTGSI